MSEATTPGQLLTVAVTWTLIHSSWQGILAATLALVGRRFASLASYRALIGAIALVAFLLAQVVTFFVLLRMGEADFVASAAQMERSLNDIRPDGYLRGIAIPRSWIGTLLNPGDRLGPIVSVIWMIVLVSLVTRAIVAARIIKTLLRKAKPVVGTRLERYVELSRAIDVRRSVAFAETKHSTVPLVAGVRSPTVLIPPDEMLKLSEPQVEALVLHELAHVRRNDVASAIGRACISSLYFFHPAILLVRRYVDHDVEEAADELAAQVLGDRPAYAGALLSLVSNRPATPLMLGAAGGSLRHRIVSVLRGSPETRRRNSSTLLGTIAAATIALFLIGQILLSAVRERADIVWLESHSLVAAVVSTLSKDVPNPAFDAALGRCIREQREGSVSDAARNELTAAALVGVESDRLYKYLCSHHGVGRTPPFGEFGTVDEQDQLVRELMAKATDARSARACAIVAAVCSLGDDTILFRYVLSTPTLARQMDLTPAQFFRIQLAKSMSGERVLRVFKGLDRIRHHASTPEHDEIVVRDLRLLADVELRLAYSKSEPDWPTLLAADDRVNAGQSLRLMRHVMQDRTTSP